MTRSPGRRCPLCDTAGATLVQRGVRYDPDLDVVRCEGCNLVRLSPVPDADELADYYATAYRDEYGDPPLPERHLADLDEARIRVDRLLASLAPETRLLEIGGGSGAFAVAVRPHVASIAVVEPDEQARAFYSEQLGVRGVESLDALPRSERFDLIVLFHVLEHVLDPVAFAGRLGALLRPGGRISCEVPNVDDALVSLFAVKSYLPFYYQKAHLWYFAPATLRLLFERVGLTVEIRGIQRYDLSNHLRWMLAGEPGGQGHYGDVFSPGALAAYADSLVAAGHADTLWAVAGEDLGYAGTSR